MMSSRLWGGLLPFSFSFRCCCLALDDAIGEMAGTLGVSRLSVLTGSVAAGAALGAPTFEAVDLLLPALRLRFRSFMTSSGDVV